MCESMRTHNSLEFLSDEFKSICKMKDIKKHKNTLANPQQSVVIEILLTSELSKQLWGEVVNTTCYLMIKYPSKPSTLNC